MSSWSLPADWVDGAQLDHSGTQIPPSEVGGQVITLYFYFYLTFFVPDLPANDSKCYPAFTVYIYAVIFKNIHFSWILFVCIKPVSTIWKNWGMVQGPDFAK